MLNKPWAAARAAAALGALQTLAFVHTAAWPLPLEPWHRQQCPSHYADTANSRPVPGGGPGGASNAAGFLSRFVGNEGRGWLHVDLAACFSELVEGLQFSAQRGKAGLHHVTLGKKGCQQRDLLHKQCSCLSLHLAHRSLGRIACIAVCFLIDR